MFASADKTPNEANKADNDDHAEDAGQERDQKSIVVARVTPTVKEGAKCRRHGSMI